MRFNFKLVAIASVFSFVLSFAIGFLSKNTDSPLNLKPTDWDIGNVYHKSNNKEVNYKALRDRNFQLLPKRLREKLGENSLAQEETLILQKLKPLPIDKTLRENFETFDDNHQVGLIGLFFEDEIYGVFQKINFETKAVTFHKVKYNEKIGPYKLTTLKPKYAELYSTSKTIKLNLFANK